MLPTEKEAKNIS